MSVTLVVLLGGMMATVYIVDPYQQYRKAAFYTFEPRDQRILNAGLAKNYPYDTIIIGSSMVENFDTRDVERLSGVQKVIKLPTRGGDIYEEAQTIKTALATGRVKNIIFGLDIYSFSASARPLAQNSRFPLYLYDRKVLNDINYLLNGRSFRRALDYVRNPYDPEKIHTQLRHLYAWQQEYAYAFAPKVQKRFYKSIYRRFFKNPAASQSANKQFSPATLAANFDAQLLPLVKNNPQVRFYFFYPPYSLIRYAMMEQKNYFDALLAFKRHIFSRLEPLENVELYDFQSVEKITHDLRLYKDSTHYHARVNAWMVRQIGSKNHRIQTQKQAAASNARLRAQLERFDPRFLLHPF